MLPQQRQKVDLSTLSEEERKLVSLCVGRHYYGGRMPQKKGPLHKTLQTRKYFDSGDYVLSKEGKATGTGVEHPQPESIPHVTSPTTGVNGIGSASLSGTSPTNASTSPIKESGLAKEPELADPNSSMEA